MQQTRAVMPRDADTRAEISAIDPDWSRETPRRAWDPPRKLLRTIRKYQSAKARGGFPARLACRWWSLWHRFWSVITQAEITLSCRIAGGLKIPHPNGIVIHPKTEIGPNCLILQQVTLGTTGSAEGAPKLAGRVDIGAGAKVLGPVTLGPHVLVGANAVVTRDVPENSVAVGIPAEVRPRKDR